MKKMFIIILLPFILTGCSTNQDLNNVTLMLDYSANTNHSGLFVADYLGFYEDEGLNVEFYTANETPVETAVATNKVDFGISYQENLLMANDQGMDLVSIYSILSHNTSGLMSNKEKNITNPKDLEDKTYCGWGTDVEKNIINSLAIEHGVNPKNISYVTLNGNFIQNNNSECDFFWEYLSWAPVQADINNIDYNFIPLIDYGYDEYTPIIITSETYINNNKEIVQSFINATIKGYEYASKHPKETTEIFLTYYPEYDEELIYNSQLIIGDYYSENNKFGYQVDEIWNNFEDFLIESNIISDNDKKEYTNEFVDNYYKSKL